jgi:importin subunit beta-1
VCSSIAEIELPRNEWPDLMHALMLSVSSPNVNLKMASLKTIGYICESIDQEVLSTQANAILTAVAQGARKEETEYDYSCSLYS